MGRNKPPNAPESRNNAKSPDSPEPRRAGGHTDIEEACHSAKRATLRPLFVSLIIMTAYHAAVTLIPAVCETLVPSLVRKLTAPAVRVVFVLVLAYVCRHFFAKGDNPQGSAAQRPRSEVRSRAVVLALCALCGALLQLALASVIALICGAERIGVVVIASDTASLSALLSAAVITPVCEEAVFRGAAYRTARLSLSPLSAALMTSTVFALIHRGTAQTASAFVCGLILAALTERSGSVRTAITLHAAFNLTSFFTWYIPLSPAICAAISVPLTAACVIFTIWKGTKQ